jgi:hypothetical protein
MGHSSVTVLQPWHHGLEAQLFAIVVIIANRTLMVIIQGVEVMEHDYGLKLRPATPCSQHTWSPVLITKPVLAATTVEDVGSIHRPGLVAKSL